MNAGAQKQNLAPTEKKMENHQQRDYFSKKKNFIKCILSGDTNRN
jgi:hypothetical protein